LPIRVFELARELNYSMDELEGRHDELGLIANSPFSIVPDSVAEKVRKKLDKRKPNVSLKRDKPVKKVVKKKIVKPKPKLTSDDEASFGSESAEDEYSEASTLLEDGSEESQTFGDDSESTSEEPSEVTDSSDVAPVRAKSVEKGPAPQKRPVPQNNRNAAQNQAAPLELGKITKGDHTNDFAVGRIVSEAPVKAKQASTANPSKKKKRKVVVDQTERLAEWSAKYGVVLNQPLPKKKDSDNKGATVQRMQLVYGHELPKKVRHREGERISAKKENSIKIACPIDLRSLSEELGVKSMDVIKFLMSQGFFMTITDKVERDVCEMVALEFDKEVEFVDIKNVAEKVQAISKQESSGDLKHRPPVITIMGHVDHGKTSLLDSIRQSRLTAAESGGITQHIGGYQVEKNGQLMTFLDTPGHAAFTAMRARGANVTDIVILLVAADDGVMPQTEEAVNHAKSAGVPIIVAVNKMDLEGANPNRIKEQLASMGLIPEEWSGSTPYMPVSAKTGEGIDALLEMISMQSEMLELKADYTRLGEAVVIEAHQEPGRGVVVSVLVRNGYISKGDPILCGRGQGFMRQMEDENGKVLTKAGPSQIVKITGLSDCPSPGDILNVMPNIRKAKEMADERQSKHRADQIGAKAGLTMESLMNQLGDADRKEFNVLIKADVQGTVEALVQGLSELGNEEVSVKLIHSNVGAVTESDILLAKASKAVILAFRVSADSKARRMAADEGVEIRNYEVIYALLEEIQKSLEGLLSPETIETMVGEVEVRQVFRITNAGNIAGSYVRSGYIERNMPVRLVRDGNVVWKGKVQALRRFKEDVKRVDTRYECGVRLENYEDIRENDIIETFTVQQVNKTL
jgi:translation initiation factor IF-2